MRCVGHSLILQKGEMKDRSVSITKAAASLAQALAEYNNASFRYNGDCNTRLRVKQKDEKREKLREETQARFQDVMEKIRELQSANSKR